MTERRRKRAAKLGTKTDAENEEIYLTFSSPKRNIVADDDDVYVHLCQRRQLVTSDERNLKWGTFFFSASLLKLSSLFAHLNCTVRHIPHSLTCDTGHVENVKKYVNIGTSFERWHNGVRTLRHSRRPQKDWCINQMLQPKVYSCRICSFSYQVPSEFPIQFTFTRLSWVVSILNSKKFHFRVLKPFGSVWKPFSFNVIWMAPQQRRRGHKIWITLSYIVWRNPMAREKAG